MEKTRGKYDIWIIIIIVVGLAVALLITSVGIKSQSIIRSLEMQVKDQKEQMGQMMYALDQCEEMKKTHQIERDVFDGIIDGKIKY